MINSKEIKYVVVTPLKNEAEHIAQTMESMCAQTIKPLLWLIINDGSTDDTEKIINRYTLNNSWIQIKKIEQSDFIKQLNIKEISARIAYIVNWGVAQIKLDYDFILKLDGDVSFDQNYCENILTAFLKNEKLGIAAGHCEYQGTKEKIRHTTNTRGPTKFFRAKCWKEIGGVYLSNGWDTIADIAALMKGWETTTLEFPFKHYKETGIRRGILKRHYWTGIFCGRVPYYPPYFLVRLIAHLNDRPIILSTLAELYGYFKARFILKENIFPKELSNYYRNIQKKRLLAMLKMKK